MTISDAYAATLRKRAVVRFIEENDRAPTESELRFILDEEERNYPTVDEIGFSGFDIAYPQFQDTSSASVENTNRQAMIDDMETLSNRLDDLLELLEDSHRGFYATSHRLGRLLSAQEQRVNNLLLLNQADVFVQGFEETFDSQDLIDYANSTVSIESGYVTLGRRGFSKIDLAESKIQATALSENGILGQSGTSKVTALKEDDGDVWEYFVYTKFPQGKVSLVVDVELAESSYVGEIRLGGLPISTNAPTTVTAFISLDGKTFTAIDPVEQALTQETVFRAGIDNVKRVQLRLTKTAADSRTRTARQYVYVFSLDSIKIYSDEFTSDLQSTLIAGPYQIIDDEGNPAFFTKASCEACTVEPTDTSVSFFLSVDGTNWEAVSHTGQASNFVSFADGSASQSASFLDLTASADSLVETVAGLEEVDYQTEAVLNTYVDADFAAQVPVQSLVVKRNIVYATAPAEILEAPAGWMFDPVTQQYGTTVYVSSPEGRWLDLGPNTAVINGQSVSGRTFLPSGYSTFATDDSNWAEITSGLLTESALKQADPLYPYNHRYLVEGYNYTEAFSGSQIYQGFDEYFGALLTYLPPEEFAVVQPGDSRYYRSFTIEDADENWYIKVRVNKTDATWRNEHLSADWSVQNGPSDQLYVKAVLATADRRLSPSIDSFRVRVI